MTDTTLRQRVSAHLKEMGQRAITPAEMDYALEAPWLDDYDRFEEEDELAKTIADHCHEWRRAPRSAKVPQASTRRRIPSERLPGMRGIPRIPPWWEKEGPRIWARYERQQHEMLTLFGLLDQSGRPTFLDFNNVAAFLAEIAHAERREGDHLLLGVPLRRERVPADYIDDETIDNELWVVYRGFQRPPLVDENGCLREPTPVERASEQKLSRLAETAQTIADQTGCDSAVAVAYLLCGMQQGLPYVQVRRSHQYRGYVITVRDRRVPKSDVAAAYQAVRGLFKLPRQPQEGPYLVVQFVEAARTADPSLTWGELYERFKRKYPNRYGSMASFRETYYAKRPRQQGK